MITVTPGQGRILEAIKNGANTRQKVRATLKIFSPPTADIRKLIDLGLVRESGHEPYILRTSGQRLQRTRTTLVVTDQPYRVGKKPRGKAQ